MIALKLMHFKEELVKTGRAIFNVPEYQDLFEDFSKVILLAVPYLTGFQISLINLRERAHRIQALSLLLMVYLQSYCNLCRTAEVHP